MTLWVPPPTDLDLSPSYVDVWRIHLNTILADETVLSADERQRAAKFHFDKDRSRYVASHASLRGILAGYLRIQPEQLEYSVNEYGKPSLPENEIDFNLAHSGDYAAVAVSRSRRVGIDVEQIRHDIEIENIASRYFSLREVSDLASLPMEQKVIGFFNCWTRKEAYIKAQGLGLSLPLDSFDVSLKPGEPVVLRATRPNADEASRWSLHSLEIDPGYVGALAVEGNDLEIRYWNWNSNR